MGGLVVLASMLVAVPPAPLSSQDVEERRTGSWNGLPLPMPNDRAELRAILDRLEAEAAPLEARLDSLEARAMEASRQRARETVVDSIDVGPFRVIGTPPELATAPDWVRSSWSAAAPRYERHLTRTPIRLYADPNPSSAAYDRYRWDLAGHRDTEGFRLDDAALDPSGSAGALRGWLGVSFNAGIPANQTVWYDLMTSPGPNNASCVEDGGRACLRALRLVPPNEGAADEIDRIGAWLGMDERAATVAEIKRLNAEEANSYLALSASQLALLDRCIEDPNATLTNPRYNCDSTVTRVVFGGDSWDPLYVVRQSLAFHAFAVGPDRAFGRLAETRPQSPERALEIVSGMPLERLVDDWWTATLSDVRPVAGGPDTEGSRSALFWAGFFVLFSFLSTRRRFG